MRNKQKFQTLERLASRHDGYFTSSQARQCGFSFALCSYHCGAGRFIRVHHGIYRLAGYPPSERSHVIIGWLQVGRDRAVVSHQSALHLYSLLEVSPDRVHLTIPRNYRRSSPSGVILHTMVRFPGKKEIATLYGLPVTMPARSIVDAAGTGASPEQITEATQKALRANLTTPTGLMFLAQEGAARTRRMIRHAIARAE